MAAISLLVAAAMASSVLVWSNRNPEAMVIGLPGRHDVEHNGQRLAGCLDCHVPFVGSPASRCLGPGCHGALATGTPPRDGKAMPIRFHVALRGVACVSCHKEHDLSHRGEREPPPFSHSIIPKQVGRDCARCHAAGQVRDHADGSEISCGVCHDTTDWSQGSIEHEKVGDLHCDVCHQPPSDDKHADAAAGTCSPCHDTKSWRK